MHFHDLASFTETVQGVSKKQNCVLYFKVKQLFGNFLQGVPDLQIDLQDESIGHVEPKIKFIRETNLLNEMGKKLPKLLLEKIPRAVVMSLLILNWVIFYRPILTWKHIFEAR